MQEMVIRLATLSGAVALVSPLEQAGSLTTTVDMEQRLESLLSLNHYQP